MRCGILIGSAMGGMKTFSAAIETLHVQARPFLIASWPSQAICSEEHRVWVRLSVTSRVKCHKLCSGESLGVHCWLRISHLISLSHRATIRWVMCCADRSVPLSCLLSV